MSKMRVLLSTEMVFVNGKMRVPACVDPSVRGCHRLEGRYPLGLETLALEAAWDLIYR